MLPNGIVADELFTSGDPCVSCGEPVLDITRGVIARRMLYHGPCWLDIMAAAAGERIIATQQS